MLYSWVQKYKEKGYNGLADKKKGRPRKVPIMKENSSPKPLKESEREEHLHVAPEAFGIVHPLEAHDE